MIGFTRALTSGDTYQGKVLKGSFDGYCPECDLALPLQYLVTDNRLDRQTVSYVCSRCDTVVLSMTRSSVDGRVLSKKAHPKLKRMIKARSLAVTEYFAKRAWSDDPSQVKGMDAQMLARQ